MHAIYNAALQAATPFVKGYLRARPKYRPLLERFHPASPGPALQSPVWIHACSLGEVNTAAPLLEAMRARWPETQLLLTTSTLSGMHRASQIRGDIPATWFPFDHPASVASFVEDIAPRALLLVETELWPNILAKCHAQGVPVALVNGRISERHYRRYRRIRGLFRPLLAHLALAAMQSPEDARRIRDLGVPKEAVAVTGSTKWDGARTVRDTGRIAALRRECGIGGNDRILIFGSTRPGDERLAAECWAALNARYANWKLIIAPRHAERAGEAVDAFRGTPVVRRTAIRDGLPGAAAARVLLVDTQGELADFYGLADAAVIGGSFYPGVEGHNPLESAALGVPTVFGPHMGNFRPIRDELLAGNGALESESPERLLETLERLMDSETERTRIGDNGRNTVLMNQGVIPRTLDLLEPYLKKTPAATNTPQA